MQAARRSQSPIFSSLPNSDNESDFLERWNSEIDRAVRHRAWASKWSCCDIEDFKQEVRIRLLSLYRARSYVSENYVRKVIRNTVSNALRDEARKLPLSSPRVFPLPHDIQKTEELLGSVTDRDWLETLLDRKALASWIRTLPRRLQSVYELLYRLDCSQLEAAQTLDISQPRVVQLHRRLIAVAKQEWG